eukprot:4366593-Prymnesium_polylepis.1
MGRSDLMSRAKLLLPQNNRAKAFDIENQTVRFRDKKERARHTELRRPNFPREKRRAFSKRND